MIRDKVVVQHWRSQRYAAGHEWREGKRVPRVEALYHVGFDGTLKGGRDGRIRNAPFFARQRQAAAEGARRRPGPATDAVEGGGARRRSNRPRTQTPRGAAAPARQSRPARPRERGSTS